MGKKSDRPLRKMTLRLFDDDLSLLRVAYPHSGYNEVVRALVSKHCRMLRTVTVEKLEERLTAEELAAI
jgi:hypothetical protein